MRCARPSILNSPLRRNISTRNPLRVVHPGTKRSGSDGPAAEGERRSWSELPNSLRDALERHLGSRVRHAISEPGGFSPGVASRLELSDGRRIFAKVVGREANPKSPEAHRTEARILTQLPPNVPVPRLLSTYDDGEWVALFLEEVDGHTPRIPWGLTELGRVVRAIEELSRLLTPAPFQVGTFGERYRREFDNWRKLKEARDRHAADLSDLDPWIHDHLEELAGLERRVHVASEGDTLLHCDLRADNILLTKGGVYFADWPGASIGADWIDLLGFLPSVAMQGGPKPWIVFDRSALTRGVDPEDVNCILAGLTGYFMASARKPAPPGLSTLRPFQLAQGVESLAWLQHRLRGR